MTPQQLLRELADMSVEDIGSVVDALSAGAWEAFECDFGKFVELFGAYEWKTTAHSAVTFAEDWAKRNELVPEFDCRAPLCPNDGRCGCS